jgi:hypothetical protein
MIFFVNGPLSLSVRKSVEEGENSRWVEVLGRCEGGLDVR